MVAELLGGPLDGAIVDGLSPMPAYLLVSSHQDGPIYRAMLTCRSSRSEHRIAYLFLGYEQTINYEFPEQSPTFKAIRQENPVIPDSAARA